MRFARRHVAFLAVAVLGGSAGLAVHGTASADAGPTETSAHAATRPHDGSPSTGRTLSFEARLRVGEELDLGGTGRTVGDQFLFSGDLVSADGQEERSVGRFGGFCVITDAVRNAGQCASTAVLPEGQLTVQGEQAGIPAPAPVVNAITGGTGEFRQARGQVTQRVLTPSTWKLTFDVLDGRHHGTGDDRVPSGEPLPLPSPLPGK